MTGPLQRELSRRERQIMDILYRLGEATVAEVRSELPDSPSYDAVRMAMTLLEKKGFLGHREEGPRYVYRPTIPHRSARRDAMLHVLETYFPGSARQAVLSLLDLKLADLSPGDLEEIEDWIERARSGQPDS